MFKSIVWSGMLDYPNEVSTTLFVGTCNWRCEFCHNIPLLNLSDINFENEILPKLLKRKSFVNHIVISGGECTCYGKLMSIVNTLKSYNFIIGIHTNGSNPDMLSKILNKVNFTGMDIKTSETKYNLITNEKVNYNNILESISLILNSNVKYEFRTTVYPKYVDLNDCFNIATLLKGFGANQYVLQQFDNSHLNNSDVKPYSKSELLNIQKECNKIMPTILRGV